MEVDMRSSSFLSPRRPMKRSRSPDADDAALGAPSAKKRLALATGSNTDVLGSNMGMNIFAFQQPQDASPGIAPPGPSTDERWVMQTKSMSLTRTQTPPADDDAMNMDTEPSQPRPPQMQMSGTQTQHQFFQVQYPNAPDIQVLGAPSYPTPAPSPGPIALPPLPLNPFLRAEHTSAHTPPIQSLMLPHQMPQQQQQRSRFSMGPRPNCELCRNRVEGHYAHFD